jgi:hypothetical protein
MNNEQTRIKDPRNVENWPLVAVNDDGIRPAGKPDECFYCNNKVGRAHDFGCVVVTRKVKVIYTVEAVIDVPYSFDAEEVISIENHDGWRYNVTELGTAEFTDVRAAFVETVDYEPSRELTND